MDEEQLEACKVDQKEWRCPLCLRMLSRKQTLQTHLRVQHDINAGNPTKKYKLYESDLSVPLPRTTSYRMKSHVLKERTTSQPSESLESKPTTDVQDETFAFEAICSDDLLEVPHLSDNDTGSIGGDDLCVQDMDVDMFDETEENESDESSSDEEQEMIQAQSGSASYVLDPPLYVIPPSTELYTSSITKNQHVLCLSALAARHNLSDTAIKDVMTFAQLHIPEGNTGVTSLNEMKEKCGFNKTYLTYQLYCDRCKKLFSDDVDNCKTPGCEGSKTDSQCNKYFVTSDLRRQLKEIMERKGMWNEIQESKNRKEDSDIITDIKSGSGYKELIKPGCFLHNTTNVTLSMFTDGVPLFKSSNVSMWPVYLLVNEIPPKERFMRKNMLLWGVWQGQGKPKMNMFLRPLVTDLQELYHNGLKLNTNDSEVTCKAMLVIATMDLQARAYFMNMTQHNGEYGCLYCEESGKVVKSGSGHCRSYPYREEQAKLRDDHSLQQHAKLAQDTGKRHLGFQGDSVIHYLSYFSVTKCCVIDYMHGVLLGVTKKLLELWFDTKHKEEPYFIGKKIAAIDRLMKQIQPPSMIHRQPRILSNTYPHWKASELRNWLLFFSVPCMVDILPGVYLQHFSCLAEATYILLSEGIAPLDIQRADLLLQTFVKNVAVLYGEHLLSLNVHNLTHLVPFVKLWGPLWGWSCFPFESFNGEIKRNIHGTGNVCRQVFWAFQAQKRISQTVNKIDRGKVKDFLENLLAGSEGKRVGKEGFQCKVIKPIELKEKSLSAEILHCLSKLTDFQKETDFLYAAKIMRNGFKMYTSSCNKVRNHNSYTISLEQQLSSGEVAIAVDMFLFHKDSKHVYAVGKLLKCTGSVLQGRLPHIKRLEYSTNTSVVPAEQLREPLVIVKNTNNIYGILMPNHFERD